MSAEVLNALIESVEIEVEDHGMLTLWLHMKHARGCQGFGGYHVKDTLGTWVREIFKVCDVDKWSRVKGKYVRVRFSESGSTIAAIGHPIEDKWFEPGVLFADREEAK